MNFPELKSISHINNIVKTFSLVGIIVIGLGAFALPERQVLEESGLTESQSRPVNGEEVILY